MQKIRGRLTPELEALAPSGDPASEAFFAPDYRTLVCHVAKLAYYNKDFLFFFRGQDADYKNRAGRSSIYPAIYRGAQLKKNDLKERFARLKEASRMLVGEFRANSILGAARLARMKLVQWSILQHYEVVPTPLADVTQSLRVACSFAMLGNSGESAWVYIFGMPYLTNRISVNSEQYLINVRLLSITPPEALRPHFQEGYLVGTTDITTDFSSKSELDLNNRLVAKFRIPNSPEFWGSEFHAIPEGALYPEGDSIDIICAKIKSELI